MKVVLKNVRLAFAKIWEPEQFNGTGEPACSGAFLMDPTTAHGKANIKLVQGAIQQVAQEKWKDKAAATVKALQAKLDLCLHNGEEKSEYDGFEGQMFVSGRNKSRPVVVDRDKTPLTQADGKPYSGCYVDVSLDVWAQDNKFGKRVNAKLLAIRFRDDGAAFSGGEGYSDTDFEDEDGDSGAAGAGDDFF
jgi:hypothetical protein